MKWNQQLFLNEVESIYSLRLADSRPKFCQAAKM